MADDRTPDQRAADEGLEAAIGRCAEAYGHTGVVTGFVVCVSTVDVEDGDMLGGVSWYLPPGDQSWVVTLGLLEAVRARFRSLFVASGEE